MEDTQRQNLKQLLNAVYSISKMRRFLKKREMETSYMYKKRQELDEIVLNKLKPIFEIVKDDPDIKYKDVWVSMLKCYIKKSYDIKIDLEILIDIVNKFMEFKSMIASQVHTIERKERLAERKKKWENISCPVRGVIFDTFPTVPINLGDSYDIDDIDFCVCLSLGASMDEYHLKANDLKQYSIPYESCKQLGIKYPAKCYVGHH